MGRSNMLYLISDIHGNLLEFKQILKKIEFDGEKDNLIIMGDILDRGPDGIALLRYVKPYILDNSMELLLGNHELFAVMYLNGVLGEENTDKVLDERTWTAFGGGDTLKSIKNMTAFEKKNLLSFLEHLPIYSEISSRYLGNVIVTHTGIDCNNYVMNADGTINVKSSIKKAFENNIYSYMVGMDLHQVPKKDKERFDQFIIVGHVPCFRLNKDMSNNFYRTDYYMDIDAGAGHMEQGGTLGCYCVTTDEEIYL